MSPAVINGMLAGIGVLILASQFHVMLDYKPIGTGIQNLVGIPTSLMNAISEGGPHLQALGIGVLTIATIFAWNGLAPKSWRLFPAPLVGAIVGIAAALVLGLNEIKYVTVPDNIWAETIFPTPEKLMRITEWPVLIGAISVAFIASAETLLCAPPPSTRCTSGPRTKYDKELTAQGVGNTHLRLPRRAADDGRHRALRRQRRGRRRDARLGHHARRLAAAVRQRAAVHAQVHSAVGTGRHPRLHRLQARLPEDRSDAAQVRQAARC